MHCVLGILCGDIHIWYYQKGKVHSMLCCSIPTQYCLLLFINNSENCGFFQKCNELGLLLYFIKNKVFYCLK